MIRKILFIIFGFLTLTISAQRTNSSPYSFFGIGEEFKPKTVEQQSMGSIGASYFAPHYLNFTNPAANAKLRYTTYTFGLLNNALTVKDGASSQSSTATSLSYFALGFPIGKKAGASLGMQPVSSVGYSLRKDIKNASGDVTQFTVFTGNGGVNRVYASFGLMLTKELSIGVEGDFIFGKITNNIVNRRANVALSTKYEQQVIVRGGSFKIGAQYQKQLKNKLNLNLGMAMKLGTDLNSRGSEKIYSFSYGATGIEIPRDVLSDVKISSKFSLPLKTTLGAGVGKTNKWYAGLEYEKQKAINATGYLDQTGAAFAYTNSSRVSFGGFYLPKINSISSYWQRVTYRAGARFETIGLSVNGDSNTTNFIPIDDFGISFGLGLPLGRQLSNLNVGFEYGKRGTTNHNLIQENYFNIRLSLSLNDIWFKKRKID